MARHLDNEVVVRVFLLICCVLGGLIGLLGLGLGLLFLSVPQAFGVGILSAALGSLFAAMYGARPVVRGVIKTIREQGESESSKSRSR